MPATTSSEFDLGVVSSRAKTFSSLSSSELPCIRRCPSSLSLEVAEIWASRNGPFHCCLGGTTLEGDQDVSIIVSLLAASPLPAQYRWSVPPDCQMDVCSGWEGVLLSMQSWNTARRVN